MKIDKKLNLVVPIYGDPIVEKDPVTDKDVEIDNVEAYVHASPISDAALDKYFRVIGRTFNEIYSGGFGLMAGPRFAAKILRENAIEMKVWDGPDGVQAGLVAEIRRLANVLVPTERGWETIPLSEAIEKQYISKKDADEVENAVTFFTVASSAHKRSELEAIMGVVCDIWGARMSSSNSTEFAASLRTSTAPAITGARAAPLSVPS